MALTDGYVNNVAVPELEVQARCNTDLVVSQVRQQLHLEGGAKLQLELLLYLRWRDGPTVEVDCLAPGQAADHVHGAACQCDTSSWNHTGQHTASQVLRSGQVGEGLRHAHVVVQPPSLKQLGDVAESCCQTDRSSDAVTCAKADHRTSMESLSSTICQKLER